MPVIPAPTHRETAEANRQFKAGLKLKSKGNLDAAFDKFSSASELDPRNVSYVTAREFAREELAMNALKQGNKAMLMHYHALHLHFQTFYNSLHNFWTHQNFQ